MRKPLPQNLQDKLSNLPDKPGVYLLKDQAGKVIYIGKAKILRHRVRSYFQEGRLEGPKLARLRLRIADLETIVTDSEMEALILEANLVKEYRPRYNINLKDDKSYPYIRVTNERFPRIFPTRKIVKDGSRYFGPYTDVGAMRELLKTIHRIFPLRTCNYDLTERAIARKRYTLCLDYHIKKCDGPCEGLISEEEYNKIVELVVDFINGKDRQIVKELRAKMEHLAELRRYEEAARIRDQIQSIEQFQYKQKVVTDEPIDRDILAVAVEDDDACGVVFKVRDGKILGRQHFYLNGVEHEPYAGVVASFLKQFYLKSDFVPDEVYLPAEIEETSDIEAWLGERRGSRLHLVTPKRGEKAGLVQMAMKNARLLLDQLRLQKTKSKGFLPHSVQALQRDLHLKAPPRVIEAFDISNIQGTDPVASMVMFVDGQPRKSGYRKFKIRSKSSPDDFAMMAETVERRYSRILRENGKMPDLILVDGGKGQLSTTVRVLRKLGIRDAPVAALAKRLDEVFIPGSPDPQNIPKTSSGLKLLQRLRDESHRFANAFHQKLRGQRTTQSVLDLIPGVGPARRRSLMRYFGSVSAIKEATLDEIASVQGIPLPLAEEIWKFFHTPSSRKRSRVAKVET